MLGQSVNASTVYILFKACPLKRRCAHGATFRICVQRQLGKGCDGLLRRQFVLSIRVCEYFAAIADCCNFAW